ncbi:Golgi to ER traffic- protein [Puccinia graminis f. sp. tritici]|uniref:Golgi to ER traffic-protein n=1 Tax=Puccinia graminis f. sp. tritici TaxID=56615 RepID=A0A5B0SBG0_PUCGR|nr:Golgi to ER traffic- protein [Puccinia graminis f. sp. tritici]
MAHDTSNVSSPVSEPTPSANRPMFSSSPQHIPTSPASEPRRSLRNVSSGQNDRTPQLARAREEFSRIQNMRDQAGKGPPRNASSKSKGPAGGAKSGPQGGDWVTVPPKKLPKQFQNLLTAQVPPIGAQKPIRGLPTPADFRTIGREGAQLDPALTDDENGSEEELHVTETLTSQAPETPKAVEVKRKKRAVSSSGPKASSSRLPKSTPKVVVQKTSLGLHPTSGVNVKVGQGGKLISKPLARQEDASKTTSSASGNLSMNVAQRVNARLIADALARHEEATRGMKSPDNMIPVGNGDFMSLEECRAFLDQIPNLSPGGDGTPTKARSTGSSADAPRSSSSSTPPVGATAILPVVTPDDHNTRGPVKIPKPFLTTQTPADSTPLPKGMMTRTPSTSSSINNVMLANLATASLDQLKSMRRICFNTKEMLSSSVSEIRAEDLHLLAPGAYGFQDRHLRLMSRYCSQLDERIAEAEKAGISDSIEVIDLTIDDPLDNQPASSSVTDKAKRLSRPSEVSASDDSPVMAKKIRTTVSPPPPPGQYIQPNLPPYSFRDIPDKDLLAGIAPKFPVNRQPSISEFTSQFQSNLSLPYTPKGATVVQHASSSKPSAPGVKTTNLGNTGVTEVQQPITQASGKNTVPTLGLSSSPRPEILPTAPKSKSGDVHKATQPPAPAILSNTPKSRSGEVHKAPHQPGTRPVLPDHQKVGKSSSGLLATSFDGVRSNVSAGDSEVDDTSGDILMGDPVSKASEKEGRSNISQTNKQDSQTNKKETSAHIQKDADVLPTGADLDDEGMEPEPEPKKKVRGKGLGKRQSKAKEKAEKSTKKKLADMTPEEKAARLEERKEKAKARKEEKAISVHAIPPQPGNLLAPMWTAKECEDARRAHKKMLIDSRNPQWDFGPELMDLVADMILAFKDDVQADKFYTKTPRFTPEGHMVDAILEVFEGDFPSATPRARRALGVAPVTQFW